MNTSNIAANTYAYNSFTPKKNQQSYQYQTSSRLLSSKTRDTVDISMQGSKKNPQQKNVLFGILGALIVSGVAFLGTKGSKNNANSKYLKNLSEGLSEYMGKKVSPSSLKSVMGKDELTEALKNLKAENYVASAENIKNGVFRADLHSHSNFSDGKGSVDNILDNVSKYADKLYSKTNQKFIFALTDHDGIDGVKKALSIIADKPEKYKNVRFVPGVEMSYAFPSKNMDNSWGVAELLIHSINPFSENVNKLCNNIQNKRKNMVSNFISEAKEIFPGVKFSRKEAEQAKFQIEPTRMNIQWNMFHYVETKRGVTQLAKEQGRNPEDMYAEVMGRLGPKDDKNLYTLAKKGLISREFNENNKLKHDICKGKSSPNIKDGKVVFASAENTFKEVIDTFSKEDDVFISFAHPVCISEHIKHRDGSYDINGLNTFLNKLVDDSNGLIKGTESHHQAYMPQYKQNASRVNLALENKGLLGLGGRDNHNFNWLDF